MAAFEDKVAHQIERDGDRIDAFHDQLKQMQVKIAACNHETDELNTALSRRIAYAIEQGDQCKY